MADAVIELAAHAEVEPATVARARFVRAQLAERRGQRDVAIAEARAALDLATSIHGDRIGEDVSAWLREHGAG
ncbi:MAG: hypothetical protein IAG13_05735 [Deltaproteobacteria bacterium]|nr:hypothetical protein [Nannocystaceae bacterium]